MYRLGAEHVAVVELSVGAGLVTVLFVFAISIAGDEGLAETAFLPSELALVVVALVVLILGGMILPLDTIDAAPEDVFDVVFWEDRALDALLQLVLIFSGVLSLLGLLGNVEEPPSQQEEFPRAHISPVLDIVEQRGLAYYEARIAVSLIDRNSALQPEKDWADSDAADDAKEESA